MTSLPTRFRSLILALVLAGLVPALPAHAAVTVTFYGHEGNRVQNGWLLFPHAFVHLHGTLESNGLPVDYAVGFTARSPGPQLLFFSDRGILKRPEPAYIADGIAYLSVVISDETYETLRSRFDYWASAEGGTYNLRQRNCITFVADLAEVVGLDVPDARTLSPNGFLKDLVAVNPPGSLAGIEHHAVAG
ncbi:hypothetical protein [Brevundimonas poindexterae]|uniref:hypothetical protein n=1 Tax=Brevundimonas poindexterae TaxID=74325 RepID=UPI001CFEE907|nr:hypothetical protein [Brevundimonas poindexterae]